jgi:hypothetical protein
LDSLTEIDAELIGILDAGDPFTGTFFYIEQPPFLRLLDALVFLMDFSLYDIFLRDFCRYSWENRLLDFF